MRITVSLIPESGIKEELKLPIAIGERASEEEVRVSLDVSRFGDRVIVKGRAASGVALTCSRCLKEYSYPVKVNFDVEYVPFSELSEEGEHELARNELDISFYRNDEIDIGDLVREQILLAIPMKPLCELDCRGICFRCGKNLNEEVCECSAGEIDPRLAPLKKLRETMRSERSKNGESDP